MKQNLVAISGNTYPVKDKIKELGGKWDKDDKVWMVPADKAAQAKALVAAAPVQKRRNTFSGGRRQYSDRTRTGGMRGCSMCRAAGGMCQSCAFDEYDC